MAGEPSRVRTSDSRSRTTAIWSSLLKISPAVERIFGGTAGPFGIGLSASMSTTTSSLMSTRPML